MNEYVSDENRLEEWGGTDPWQYVWEPEAHGPEGEFQLNFRILGIYRPKLK